MKVALRIDLSSRRGREAMRAIMDILEREDAPSPAAPAPAPAPAPSPAPSSAPAHVFVGGGGPSFPEAPLPSPLPAPGREGPPPPTSAPSTRPLPSRPEERDPKRPWDDEDKRTAWTLWQAGERPTAIARRIQREPNRVLVMIGSWRTGKTAPPSEGAAVPEPEAPAAPDTAPDTAVARAPAGEDGPVSPSAVDVAAGESPPDQAPPPDPAPPPVAAPVEAPVEAPSRPPAPARDGGWSPEEDLTLLRALGAGLSVADASGQLAGRSAEDARRRWRELVPVPGIDAQRRALEKAVAAVAAERG